METFAHVRFRANVVFVFCCCCCFRVFCFVLFCLLVSFCCCFGLWSLVCFVASDLLTTICPLATVNVCVIIAVVVITIVITIIITIVT